MEILLQVPMETMHTTSFHGIYMNFRGNYMSEPSKQKSLRMKVNEFNIFSPLLNLAQWTSYME